MDNSQQKTSSNIWIKYGLAGFALGICIVAVSAVSLVAVQVANPPPTPTLLPTPTVAARALLDAAREAFTNGNLQLAIDTLSPRLEDFTNPEDLSEALRYLARAEASLGHYQISAAYLERLVQISPTFEDYGTLARVYDSAGDTKHALANYLIILKMDDPALTPGLRQQIQARVDQLEAILTGSTPTRGP